MKLSTKWSPMGLQKFKIDPNRSPRSAHEFGNIKIYNNIDRNDQNRQNDDDGDDDDDDDDDLSNVGFVDCFSALQLPCRPTHPTRPCNMHGEQSADQALDWLFAC
eukprot:921438-Karenia_brevis.AAC.1